MKPKYKNIQIGSKSIRLNINDGRPYEIDPMELNLVGWIKITWIGEENIYFLASDIKTKQYYEFYSKVR